MSTGKFQRSSNNSRDCFKSGLGLTATRKAS